MLGFLGKVEWGERSQFAGVRTHVEGCDLEKIDGWVSDIDEGRSSGDTGPGVCGGDGVDGVGET